MGKTNDLTGQKFGRLTVIKRIGRSKWRTPIWLCQCECGNIKDIRSKSLKNGETQSCGCLQKEKTSQISVKNLIGQKFGKLTVLYRAGPSNNREVIWHCKCDCGKEIDVVAHSLTTGNTKSCGCLNKQLASERALIDLTGQKFGKLTVLYKSSNIGDRVKWHCKCDCGNECDVLAYLLTKQMTQSCGCITRSIGETTIEKLLDSINMPYITEKTFSTCKFLDTNCYARFDFYVNNQYLIEYDGIQHFKITGTKRGNLQQVIKTKQHDQYKNQWCKDNNIPLIRIPYTHLNDLKIEDLLLETSEYIVK